MTVILRKAKDLEPVFNRREAYVMADYIKRFDDSIIHTTVRQRKDGPEVENYALAWSVWCRTNLGNTIEFSRESDYRKYSCAKQKAPDTSEAFLHRGDTSA